MTPTELRELLIAIIEEAQVAESWGTAFSLESAIVRILALTGTRPVLPRGTRLILASENLLETWGTRTEDGYRITVEWGEQKPEGWYEPTFRIHYEGEKP